MFLSGLDLSFRLLDHSIPWNINQGLFDQQGKDYTEEVKR